MTNYGDHNRDGNSGRERGCPFEVNQGLSRYPCPSCGSRRANSVGRDGRGNDIYQCDDCGTKYRAT